MLIYCKKCNAIHATYIQVGYTVDGNLEISVDINTNEETPIFSYSSPIILFQCKICKSMSDGFANKGKDIDLIPSYISIPDNIKPLFKQNKNILSIYINKCSAQELLNVYDFINTPVL